MKPKSVSKGISRREFISSGSRLAAGAGAAVAVGLHEAEWLRASELPGSKMKFGLVTYLWGKDWPLPALIRHCTTAGALGVELRVDHAHGVAAHLSKRQRYEVRLRFDNSPVTAVGMGCNWSFHHEEAAKLTANIEGAKTYLQLSHDIGATGVKVKPNFAPLTDQKGRIISQIAQSLNTVGKFASDLGQEVRVEVHGRNSQQLPIMKAIFDQVEERSVTICWNSNKQDLDGEGLEHNFSLVKDRFGSTVHVREFDVGNYPYQELMNLFVEMDYHGWILMEARTVPGDRVQALAQQKGLFDQMRTNARARLQTKK